MERRTHKALFALASAGTRVTLVDDDIDNGTSGFSISHMRISKLYFRRAVENIALLKCLCIRINNLGNTQTTDNFNTCYFYDGVNIPTQKFFANIISENEQNSTITYNTNGGWDFINKTEQSDNVKDIEILIYDQGDTLCEDISIDNRLYLELEFY